MPDAMQDITSVNFSTSEQHKELGEIRKKRNDLDTKGVLEFFDQRNPFSKDKALRNIETRASGDEKVYAEKAHETGKEIMKTMYGQIVSEYVFQKSRQVTTLSSMLNIKVDDDEIKVVPQLLFQRLLVAAAGKYHRHIRDIQIRIKQCPNINVRYLRIDEISRQVILGRFLLPEKGDPRIYKGRRNGII